MKKIMFLLFGLSFLFFFGISPGSSAKAYSMDEIGDYTKIGKYDPNGYSYVGVSISLDGEVVYYAVDTWKREGEKWALVGTNYNGIKRDNSTDYVGRNDDNPILLRTDTCRFSLYHNMIFERMPSDFSLISKGFYQGKEFYRTEDYSFEDHAMRNSDSYSLFYSDSLTNLSHYSAGVPSFSYEFYTPIRLGESEEVKTNIPDGAYYTEPGEAFVTSDGYYINKLPEVKYMKPGYTVVFEGWYDKETGGSKIQEKTEIPYGTKLYGHFAVSANHYTVTCYDIHGTDISGREIGKTVFTAIQGEKVSGASLGSDTTEGAYYDGLIYHSGTEKTVYYDTTIYRFFTYPYYDVTYVDQVSGGKGNGKVLRSESVQRELYSEVSGEELGTVPDSGEYYKGFCYSGASKAIVSKEGTTVYRYFRPHKYRILFDGNGATKGMMRDMEDCLYGDEFTLLPNSFQKEISIHFDLNTQNASSKTSELTVSQKFLGWSLEPDGALLCDDKAVVSDLTDQEETVTLYAIWSG
ncbi:MAG: hypothetical protein IJ733_15525, partial [Lachnospiraceae bacterium]|nr:hypothetical protein [Lachnospiraceae bacterium]